MRSFKEYLADIQNTREYDVQAKHFETNEHFIVDDDDAIHILNESIDPDPTNNKRIIITHDGDNKPKGVSGLSVPKHMWVGRAATPGGKISKKTGKLTKPTSAILGMKDRNVARAEVYGSDRRDPLTVPEIETIHKDVLDQHFRKPKSEQINDEIASIRKLQAAKHMSPDKKGVFGIARTTDDSEKTDTILHEKDANGRGYLAAACKGVAGHTVYTSGHGDQAQHRIVNTCPGQTRGCGGGVDAHGVADTSRGTCFAPQAEQQYAAASVRRSYIDQAKHDPAMTRDFILAHTHSIRIGAEIADSKKKNFVIRPNTLNENDRSTKHVVVGLNKQREAEGKPRIISYQYSKDNELHDPENGVHVTFSNIGPKVINGEMVKENTNRDTRRVHATITATNASLEPLRNRQGNKTPAKHSYLVTNLPRGGSADKEYQKHAKHIKYWDKGTILSPEELSSTPKEGHFDGEGKPTTPEKAHYGFRVVGERKYEYQNQHILHPRMTKVNAHMIPSDSRFQDDQYMPPATKRFKSKTGMMAGGIIVTSATTSTSGERSNSSFTHRIDDAKLETIKKTGVHEIDTPEEQEASRDHPYIGEHSVITFMKPKKKK